MNSLFSVFWTYKSNKNLRNRECYQKIKAIGFSGGLFHWILFKRTFFVRHSFPWFSAFWGCGRCANLLNDNICKVLICKRLSDAGFTAFWLDRKRRLRKRQSGGYVCWACWLKAIWCCLLKTGWQKRRMPSQSKVTLHRLHPSEEWCIRVCSNDMG